jgi:hypothetical protein
MPSSRKQKRYASDWQTQVSISNDHTLKCRVKGNFHARFGIGGGESDLPANHTKNDAKEIRHHFPLSQMATSFLLLPFGYARFRGRFLSVNRQSASPAMSTATSTKKAISAPITVKRAS